MTLLTAEQRATAWAALPTTDWDIIIVGGGITGAGLLHAATAAGGRALLLEQRDFAWGTSSRSSKLVHGGLRYLANGQIGVTRESVRERRLLLAEAPGLIEPLGFVLPLTAGAWLKNWSYRLGLGVYDLLGGFQQPHEALSATELRWQAPDLIGSAGALRYFDAQTDDARLVLRVLQDAAAAGATAVNYAAVKQLVREDGAVAGVVVHDVVTGSMVTLRAGAVINATGAWADTLRVEAGAQPHMRPLRGSHLVFAAWRLPAVQALTLAHPRDGRPVFVLPWEGVTLVGTTDCDHHAPLSLEPQISPVEAEYLLAAVRHYFPRLELSSADVVSTWAGVRPVVDTGAEDPSHESRDHVVWQEHGLLTVTGGKLTTFRAIAAAALGALVERLPVLANRPRPAFSTAAALPELTPASVVRRLSSRYGALADQVLAAAQPGELERAGGTPTLWVELRWAARSEGVQHLDDLLLRRTRLGLLLPQGAAALLPRVQAICAAELGWDQPRWAREQVAYAQLIDRAYSLPVLPALVPPAAAAAPRRWPWPGLLLGLAGLVWLWRRRGHVAH